MAAEAGSRRGAAARRKTKEAAVGAAARVLFYPTLLYNVVRSKVQAEFRWWDEVDQFVLLGAVPFHRDVTRLQKLGVHGVITLNEPFETLVPSSMYKSRGIDHLVIPTRDYMFAPSLADINQAIDFIHRNASCGKITYIHCKAGRGRSTTIVLCYLVKYKNMTPAAAFERVRSKRARVLLTHSQWKAVQEFSKKNADLAAPTSDSATASPARDAVRVTVADLNGNDAPEFLRGCQLV
ncbi:phosphatidylglycerophosphate phosphatase PTPMT2-like isoform X1 [Miscanthus floridulus]|uniref:phosphatidylglycerophosphate phosphatase PTPMT2-like isoform X1 n=1 Tax=Miscanthus floridulus TaxID=154761 RepID=UPI0034585BF9